MQKHYVVGDVHGEYEVLLALVQKLPKDAKLIFVGDLIDRGLQSREVVAFVRKNNYQVVMGNHEVYMLHYGAELIEHHVDDVKVEIDKEWLQNGGVATLLSYDLLKIRDDGSYQILKNKKAIEVFKNDIEWMSTLPLYLELDTKHSSGKSVVISHSNISKVWSIRNDDKRQKEFISVVLWGRESETSDEANIFNIYGHTPQKKGMKIEKNYICLDTGCCYKQYEAYGILSAYCIESGEIFEVGR